MSYHRQKELKLVKLIKTVKLVDPIEMRKTDKFGETRLVLHVPSSS